MTDDLPPGMTVEYLHGEPAVVGGVSIREPGLLGVRICYEDLDVVMGIDGWNFVRDLTHSEMVRAVREMTR